MAKFTIRLTKEVILLWAANAYNFDANKTALILDKTDPEYIEVLWDAQEE